MIENKDFILFFEKDLSSIMEDLLPYLSVKKQELLLFFRMPNFPKVQIDLFENREDYYECLDLYGNVENRIIFNYSGISKEQMLPFLRSTILHRYIQLFYTKMVENHQTKAFWIEEGLAQILSGEKGKIERNDFTFRMFYFDKIVRRDKKVPYQTFFQTKTRFVVNQDFDYDRYDISYLLVHYLMERYSDIYPIITDEVMIKELETTILEDCISFYNQKYPVKTQFYEIQNDSELMDYMNKNIVYGWLDNKKQEHIDSLKGFRENYRISSINEILKKGLGTCIEQAKLIKYWFDLKGIENKIFCYRSLNDDPKSNDIKMHCFVLFHYGEFWYHFEHSAVKARGIYKFNTLEEAIEKTSKKFLNGVVDTELIELPIIPENLTYEEFNQYVSHFEIYEVEKEMNR